MNEFSYNDIELIGFDGTPTVDCALYLPIVQHKESKLIFKLSPRSWKPASKLYQPEEFKELINARATFISSPKSIKAGEVVIYLSNLFLTTLGGRFPSDLEWIEIPADDGIAILMPEQEAENFLNEQAEFLMNEATDEIKSFLISEDHIARERANSLLVLARQAANDSKLRSHIFLRYALTLKYSNLPEKLDNLFELRMKKEFPEWTWQSFQLRLTRLTEMLHDAAIRKRNTKPESLSSEYMITDVNRLLSNIRSGSEHLIIAACREAALDFLSYYPIDRAEINEVAFKIMHADRIRLAASTVKVLAGEPAFYYFYSQKKIRLIDTNDPFDCIGFNSTVLELTDEGYNLGGVAEAIKHSSSRSATARA